MKGEIINVSRFCTEDGPGIRTTVFLKGCPLTCAWCHNPESQKLEKELFYYPEKCVECKRCESVCPFGAHTFLAGKHALLRERCHFCGACVDICPTGALERIGKTADTDEIVAEVLRDKPFYQTSGGGVTVSGGEPLFQADFTAELLKKCRENGVSTAIETSGFASEKDFLKVLAECDLVLFDVKDTNEKRHQKNTGVPLAPIMKNLRLLDESGVPFIIRLPIVPTFNDDERHFSAVKALFKTLKNCRGVEVMPYHTLGEYKYGLLQREYALSHVKNPPDKQADEWKKYFE